MAGRSDIKLDVDNPFDAVVFLEDSYYNDGYNEGHAAGKQRGQEEGWNLGTEKGKEIGQEIGFYEGFVLMWLKLNENGQPLKPRAKKLLLQLKKSIGELTLDDPQNQNEFDSIENIRGKFKQLTSLLGGTSGQNEDSTVSF